MTQVPSPGQGYLQSLALSGQAVENVGTNMNARADRRQRDRLEALSRRSQADIAGMQADTHERIAKARGEIDRENIDAQKEIAEGRQGGFDKQRIFTGEQQQLDREQRTREGMSSIIMQEADRNHELRLKSLDVEIMASRNDHLRALGEDAIEKELSALKKTESLARQVSDLEDNIAGLEIARSTFYDPQGKTMMGRRLLDFHTQIREYQGGIDNMMAGIYKTVNITSDRALHNWSSEGRSSGITGGIRKDPEQDTLYDLYVNGKKGQPYRFSAGFNVPQSEEDRRNAERMSRATNPHEMMARTEMIEHMVGAANLSGIVMVERQGEFQRQLSSYMSNMSNGWDMKEREFIDDGFKNSAFSALHKMRKLGATDQMIGFAAQAFVDQSRRYTGSGGGTILATALGDHTLDPDHAKYDADKLARLQRLFRPMSSIFATSGKLEGARYTNDDGVEVIFGTEDDVTTKALKGYDNHKKANKNFAVKLMADLIMINRDEKTAIQWEDTLSRMTDPNHPTQTMWETVTLYLDKRARDIEALPDIDTDTARMIEKMMHLHGVDAVQAYISEFKGDYKDMNAELREMMGEYNYKLDALRNLRDVEGEYFTQQLEGLAKPENQPDYTEAKEALLGDL